MSNSALVSYTRLSPFNSGRRNHVVDTVSVHCMAGDLTVESAGRLFQTRESSSNYGIGSDGRIALYVDEANRSWCTSSASNDNRAITIEVANNGGPNEGWPISDKAYESLILLLTDICKRNNIKALLWKGDKSLIGHVDKQNMTVHRWFANKACPGDYLYSRHADIAQRVNKNLEKEDDMDISKLTDAQIDELWNRLISRRNTIATSEYAAASSKKGVDSGIFSDGNKDGLIDTPMAPVLRQDLAVVLNRLGALDKT